MELSALAPGKVNLCLFVGRRREDGRHALVTLLESVSLADELMLSTEGASDEVLCAGVDGPNLVSAALDGIRARGWRGPAVRVVVAKRIPVAGGMGGGSADAAAALRLASHLEPLPDGLVHDLAAELGADVPGQLEPGVALGTGAGDDVQLLPALMPHAFVIVPSPHRLSTADVYAEADRLGLARDADELAEFEQRLTASLERNGRPSGELIVNHLEPAALSLCPEIGPAVDAIREAGAEDALVSGSGPTTFGIFWGDAAGERAATAAAALSASHEGATSAVPVGADFGHPRVRAQSVADR